MGQEHDDVLSSIHKHNTLRRMMDHSTPPEEREHIASKWRDKWPEVQAYYEEMKKLAAGYTIDIKTQSPRHEVLRHRALSKPPFADAPRHVDMPITVHKEQKDGPLEITHMKVRELSATPHGFFVGGTVTGRFSSKEPNISNRPRGDAEMPNLCNEIALGSSQLCVLPMPEPQEKVMQKKRIFVADHFSLDMIKDSGGLEQGRISKGEAKLFVHLADYELCSLIKDEHMATLLTDLLQVKLEVDSRDAKSFIGIGEVVIFVEELDKGLQFWRLDVLKETRAQGSGKKAWSW